MVQTEKDDGVRDEEGHQSEEDTPEDWWPVFHDVPVEDELLHDALVHVGKLKAQEVAHGPDEVVELENLGICI